MNYKKHIKLCIGFTTALLLHTTIFAAGYQLNANQVNEYSNGWFSPIIEDVNGSNTKTVFGLYVPTTSYDYQYPSIARFNSVTGIDSNWIYSSYTGTNDGNDYSDIRFKKTLEGKYYYQTKQGGCAIYQNLTNSFAYLTPTDKYSTYAIADSKGTTDMFGLEGKLVSWNYYSLLIKKFSYNSALNNNKGGYGYGSSYINFSINVSGLEYTEQLAYKPSILIALNANEFLVISNKKIYKLDSRRDWGDSIVSETNMPTHIASADPNQSNMSAPISLGDGTYCIRVDYNKYYTCILRLDSNGNTIQTVELGNTYYEQEAQRLDYTVYYKKGYNSTDFCVKSSNKLLYFGGYNNVEAIYEIDLATGSFNAYTVPVTYYRFNSFAGCADIYVKNKQVYVTMQREMTDPYTTGQRRKLTSYIIYDPTPPTVAIATNTSLIGDNTPMIFSVNVSEPYSYLYIHDVTNNTGIWTGGGHTPVTLNLDFEGNKSILVQILDTDWSVLNTSNVLTFNKRNILNRAYLAANTKTGLQNFIVIDDVERYFENNAANQKLVADMKAKASGTFLIYNDISDVLVPLLKT